MRATGQRSSRSLPGCVLKAGEQGVLMRSTRLAPIVKGLEQGIGLDALETLIWDYHCGKHFVEEVKRAS